MYPIGKAFLINNKSTIIYKFLISRNTRFHFKIIYYIYIHYTVKKKKLKIAIERGRKSLTNIKALITLNMSLGLE